MQVHDQCYQNWRLCTVVAWTWSSSNNIKHVVKCHVPISEPSCKTLCSKRCCKIKRKPWGITSNRCPQSVTKKHRKRMAQEHFGASKRGSSVAKVWLGVSPIRLWKSNHVIQWARKPWRLDQEWRQVDFDSSRRRHCGTCKNNEWTTGKVWASWSSKSAFCN